MATATALRWCLIVVAACQFVADAQSNSEAAAASFNQQDSQADGADVTVVISQIVYIQH